MSGTVLGGLHSYSFNKYLLSVSYMPSTPLDAGDERKTKTKSPHSGSFGSLCFTGEDRW